MKKPPLRSRSRSGSGTGSGTGSGSVTPIPVRHQFDHEVPTVIHHPEEKMTALARLTRRLILQPGKLTTWGLGILAVVLAIVVAANWSSSNRTKTSEVWTKLYAETKPDALAETARKYPGTPAAQWALLHAANEYYSTAMGDLPNNRDVAVSNVKRALELYEQVAGEAPKDSFLARAALFGKARCLEARNELAQAIAQYDLVASTWPGSPEAQEAKELAEALKKPEAAAFYKELFAYSPPKVTLPLPPLGNERFDLPGSTLRKGAASSKGTMGPSVTVPPPPVEVTPPGAKELRPAPGTGQIPLDVFVPETKPEAKTPPKAPR
jgi:hypothetical protein